MRRGSVTPEEEREQSEATQAAVKEALASVAPVVAENEEEKAEYQLEEAFAEDEEARALLQKQKALKQFTSLFADKVFFLSREVPRESVEFLILCFGGKIGWEGEGSPFSYTDPAITHVVMDRPTIPQPLPNRDYVQPQWLFDSVLPTGQAAAAASVAVRGQRGGGVDEGGSCDVDTRPSTRRSWTS